MDGIVAHIEETAGALPTTRGACRARLIALQDQIAAIRAAIASADLDRQARRGQGDARWFHRAKTALRHKRREVAELTAWLSTRPGRMDVFRLCVIEVVRADYDEAGWRRVMDEAHRRLQDQEAA